MIHDIARTLAPMRFDRLGAPARDKLLLCLLANVSVAVAGVPITRLPAPPAAPAGLQGPRLFNGTRAGDARAAAFYNGAAMHARTQDDFHPIGNLHIATVVLPALLAAAESGISGARFLDALLAGYAAAAGLSRQFSPSTTPRGLRSTCLYAPFGATAAVVRARGLDDAAMANALSLTASMVGGTTQCWLDGSDEYQLHTGLGAANALLACDLTQAGVRGGAHALDGRAGLYAAVVGQVPCFDDIAGDFEPEAAVLETVLKRYPVSGICQPVVLAAERVVARLGGVAPASMSLRMRTFELRYPGTSNPGPFTSFSDRLMSARYCAASVLTRGGFDFAAFLGEVDAPMQALIDGAELSGDDGYPPLSCELRVTGADGRKVTEAVVDGGQQLSIDWSSVDVWAAPLWGVAGRPEADYARWRAAVRGLPAAADCRALLDAIAA